jgi:protein TonB
MAAENAQEAPQNNGGEERAGDSIPGAAKQAGPDHEHTILDSEPDELTLLRLRRARSKEPRRPPEPVALPIRNNQPGPVALRRVAPAPPAAVAPERLEPSHKRLFIELAAAFFVLVAGGTFAAFYFRQTSADQVRVAPAVIHATVPVSSLQMHVQPEGDRVLVSWNPRASGVQNATGGLLTIADSGEQREFSLDASQAANGSVLYRPVSDDVSFRLQIRDASGAVFNDSLRVLDPARKAVGQYSQSASAPRAGPGKLNDAGQAIITAGPKPSRTQVASGGQPGVAHPPVSEQAALNHAPAKPASAEAVHSETAPITNDHASLQPPVTAPAGAGQTTPVENPRRSHAPGTIAANHPPAPEQTAGQNPPATSTLHTPVAQSPPENPGEANPHTGNSMGIVAQSAAVPESFVPPQPVRQVMPSLRSSLAATLVPGTKVAVKVTIDTKGRVKRAEVVGNLQDVDIGVQKAAVEAAKQWRFNPARLNGEKVSAEHTIVFEFEPSVK